VPVAARTDERSSSDTLDEHGAGSGLERGRMRDDPFERAVARVEREEEVASRVGVVAGIQLAIGGLGLLLGALGFVTVAGLGWVSQDPVVQAWMGGIGGLIAGFFGLLSVPTLIGGFGLLRRKPWARVLGMVLGAIELFQVPVGTVLGGYTLFVLAQERTRAYFERSIRD
jgi:hypothetical protein